MKIVDKTGNVKKSFKELDLEDVFKWEGRLFMKVARVRDYQYNAYDLTKRRLTSFDDAGEVEYIPAELILHQRGWEDKNNG